MKQYWVALLVGIWQRVVAWCSAGLLLSFALTMSVALGLAPWSYSVFTAFGGAFLLGAIDARASKGLSAAARKIFGTTRQPAFAQIFERLALDAMRLKRLIWWFFFGKLRCWGAFNPAYPTHNKSSLPSVFRR